MTIDTDFSKYRDAGDPYWVDVQPAGEFLGLPDKTVLHSGPPIEFARMCPIHRRSMINACYMEGWAKTEAEAVALLEKGEVACEAAYDYATDGSGIGIITKSVPLLIVEDREFGNARAGLFPSEGRFGGGFTGWGIYSEDIAANLKWIGTRLFRELVPVIQDAGGFPMKALFAEARRMGDELHSSQRAIDALFTRVIIPHVLKCSNKDELLDYFATADRFTHNFGQASSRALLLGLERAVLGKGGNVAVTPRAGTGVVVAAGGNGVEYGIKVAYNGETRWYTAPSPMIVGPYLTPGAKKENQLPWIGDSSVVECRGWGGQIRPINPAFESQSEGGGGGEGAAPTVTCSGGAIAAQGTVSSRSGGAIAAGPIINGGMMDVNGGWMGAGSTRMPSACFVGNL